MDRLTALIQDKQNPTVVGLDPRPELLPGQLIEQARQRAAGSMARMGLDPKDPQQTEGEQAQAVWADHLARAYLRFNLAILEGVADLVPAVKPQIAMYEALGPWGIRAYTGTCRAAADRGLYVIGDVKRGDIGSTAEAYAAHLDGLPLSFAPGQAVDGPARAGGRFPWYEDALTINVYLGSDGVQPFLQAAEHIQGDLFALVRTSNPSGSQIQELGLDPDSGGGTIYQRLGGLVETWGQPSIGESGYSRLGAVVGATHPEDGALLRQAMPHTFFLVPGYGAQGGSAADVAPMFDRSGGGAVVNSSRGIIAAWRKDPDYSPQLSVQAALGMVTRDARRAAQAMKDDLNQAIKEAR